MTTNVEIAEKLCCGLDDVVILSLEEYERMHERIVWLECLESAGVDNWSGYNHAIDIRNGDMI